MRRSEEATPPPRVARARDGTPPIPAPRPLRRDAFLDPTDGLRGEPLEQPDLGPSREDSHGVEHRPRRLAKTRGASQDRISHRIRDREIWGRERLRDEERIPRRLAVELLGINVPHRGEQRHRIGGQPLHLEPGHALAASDVAEHQAKRMRTIELVLTIRDDNQSTNRRDPAPDETHNIERRLVRPVKILQDNQRRRPRRQLAHERIRDLIGSRPALHKPLEIAAGQPGDIEQRPKRARREQRITFPPQNASRASLLVAETPQQRRLADARLTSHKREATLTLVADGGHPRAQSGEVALSLQKL